MTPLIFHAIDFSAREVGSGLAVSALIGTVVRLLSGALLDRGVRCSWPVRGTTLLAIAADLILLQADNYNSYLLGQLLLGCAAGLYWPAIELAVPLSCGSLPSGRGYALVRSADALGIGIGTLIGTAAATLGMLRTVYRVEAVCMGAVLVLISLVPLQEGPPYRNLSGNSPEPVGQRQMSQLPWLLPLMPVLLISVVATGILALQQSALPLDLVRGGLVRPALSESHSSALIALQLTLLVSLQWPVGRWLAERSVAFGLGLSLAGFSLGCSLIALSSLFENGTILVLAALLPMAFAQAAFLPTATEAVIEETPPEHRGLAMALFSQCFAISAIVAPLAGGALLDLQNNGLLLWLLMGGTCLVMLPTLCSLKLRYGATATAQGILRRNTNNALKL
ncbi:MFS transporter [Parasynechococcus sp.]|uniref:MFS transporter n=1 Tax=Parasynechococcus sp. TaxID=3101203 RepID=UPI003703F34E